MLKNRNANYQATSVLADDTVLMNMSAFVSDSGNVSFNQSIPNMAVYEANKTTADNDFESFKDDILSSIE